MKRVLIVGGQGYIGLNYTLYNLSHHNKSAAAKRDSILSLDISEENIHMYGAKFTYSPVKKHKDIISYRNVDFGDLSEMGKCILEYDPEVILILADVSSISSAHVGKSKGATNKCITNMRNFLSLPTKMGKDWGVKEIVYLSSYAIYGSHYLGTVVDTETYPHKSHSNHSKFYGVMAIEYARMKYEEEKLLLGLPPNIGTNVVVLRMPNIVGLYDPYRVWKRLQTPTSFSHRVMSKLCHSSLVKKVYGLNEQVCIYRDHRRDVGGSSRYPIRNYAHVFNACRVIKHVIDHFYDLQGHRKLYNYTEDSNYYSTLDLIARVKKITGTAPTILKDSRPKHEVAFMGCDSSLIRKEIPSIEGIVPLPIERAVLETSVDILDKHMCRIKGITPSGINKHILL
jgi:nucleoside-diphosphate-sugar epimerase